MVLAPDEPLSRHTFLHVDAGALKHYWSSAPDRQTTGFVLDWFSSKRLAICTGQNPSSFVSAGIATPPAEGKKRIAFTLPRSAVVAQRSPPALNEVAVTCTLHRGPIVELARRAQAAGLDLSVFGSFAWEYLTGLTYVTANSDLDVLWRPRNLHELEGGIELLRRWESEFGLQADGEAVFPNEDAVSWRELAMSANTVLVKSPNGPRLLSRIGCRALLSGNGASP